MSLLSFIAITLIALVTTWLFSAVSNWIEWSRVIKAIEREASKEIESVPILSVFKDSRPDKEFVKEKTVKIFNTILPLTKNLILFDKKDEKALIELIALQVSLSLHDKHVLYWKEMVEQEKARMGKLLQEQKVVLEEIASLETTIEQLKNEQKDT